MAPVVVVVVVAVVVMVQLMALERLLPFHFCLAYISTFELAKFLVRQETAGLHAKNPTETW